MLHQDLFSLCAEGNEDDDEDEDGGWLADLCSDVDRYAQPLVSECVSVKS